MSDHWVYELEDEVNTYASRIANFARHYDGVHVLLKNREEVGSTFIPDLNLAKVERDDFPGDKQPAHYYHNWRFNNPYWSLFWHLNFDFVAFIVILYSFLFLLLINLFHIY